MKSFQFTSLSILAAVDLLSPPISGFGAESRSAKTLTPGDNLVVDGIRDSSRLKTKRNNQELS